MKQTLTDNKFGNCLQTCVAKLLGKPLDHVPNFNLYEDQWWTAMAMYLGIHGLAPDFKPDEAPPRDGKEYITSLKFKIHSAGLAHAVIMKDGAVVFDPWPVVNYSYGDSMISGYYVFTKMK